MAILSHQECTQPPNAPALSEQQWRAVHDGIHGAVFRDARQSPIASFAGLCAVLRWQEEREVASWGGAWGSFELPAGTSMVLPDQPPLPIVGAEAMTRTGTSSPAGCPAKNCRLLMAA